MLVLRATVEGFYGRPWSHEERLEHLSFCAGVGLGTYVYGPKDDPWHRERWREPYPPDELARLESLVTHAAACGVTFVLAIHPGLSMAWDDPTEQEALHAKAAQLWEVGVRRFALFFDDIPLSEDPASDGAAHARVCARFVSGFLVPRGAAPGAEAPFLMVPTDYAGTDVSPYRSALGEHLPDHTVVWWTGPDIVVGEISEDDVRAARATFGHPLALWDNFPVNDFDPARLFLGPLTGRPPGGDLVGITANPMLQPRASRIALTTVAEYARDPSSYDASAAHARAVAALVPDPLRPLVEVCSSWPPSADPSPLLTALLEAGDPAPIIEALRPLAGMPADLDDDLARELGPWVLAGRDIARAGIAAAELLAGRGDVAATRSALVAAESHYANVLRPVLPPFVRRVLDRVDPPSPDARGERVAAVIRTGAAPGDLALEGVLRDLGYAITSSYDEDVELVVVSRSATREQALAVRNVPVPMVAWGHLVALGLCTDSGVHLAADHVLVGEEPVRVYVGPGKLTWGEPAHDAHVLARSAENGRPVIFWYDDPAPAHRAALLLGSDGLAPWLISPRGRDLVADALSRAAAAR